MYRVGRHELNFACVHAVCLTDAFITSCYILLWGYGLLKHGGLLITLQTKAILALLLQERHKYTKYYFQKEKT